MSLKGRFSQQEKKVKGVSTFSPNMPVSAFYLAYLEGLHRENQLSFCRHINGELNLHGSDAAFLWLMRVRLFEKSLFCLWSSVETQTCKPLIQTTRRNQHLSLLHLLFISNDPQLLKRSVILMRAGEASEGFMAGCERCGWAHRAVAGDGAGIIAQTLKRKVNLPFFPPDYLFPNMESSRMMFKPLLDTKEVWRFLSPAQNLPAG